MIVNRLILEWEERIRLHQEKEMEFNQWRSKNFKDERPALIKEEKGVEDEGEVTLYLMRRSLEVLSSFIWMILRRYFSFGRYLDELHVTWAHLEKKRTRLRINTKTLEDLCSQSLETTSQAILDDVTTHQVTVSHISRRCQLAPTRTQI
ncbi:hypothetical protein Tco_0349617 [Tanacetum coccineum]